MTFDEATTWVLLERMRSSEPVGTVAQVATVTGTDQHQALEITLAATRRVAAARVRDVSAVRTPETFTAALIGAFQSADGDRALSALQQSGHLEEFLDRAERDFAERPGVRRPPRVDVSYEAYTSGRLHAHSASRTKRPAPRTSANGYLTIQRGHAGEMLTVEVDPEWLLGARSEHLETAIEQAMFITTDGE